MKEKMPVTVINDNDLRQRLEEHSYPVPPITDTTRKILIKKLNQLDEQKKKSHQDNRKKGGGVYANIDYSSAEDDDFPPPLANSTQRIGVTSKTNGSNGNVGMAKRGRVTRNSRHNSRAGTPQNGGGLVGNRRHPAHNLMANSETEEGSEEEEEEEDICEEEEEEESEEEDEVNGGVDRVDLGVQTSLLDSPSPVIQQQTRFRNQRLGSGGICSPVTTASGPGFVATPTSHLRSPYLRKNLNKHGSLNEALSTLPHQAVKSPPETPEPPTTQSPAPHRQPANQSYSRGLDTSTSSQSSWIVSSLIMSTAAIFFLFLAYQYVNLVPGTNKETALTIPICGGLAGQMPHINCVPSNELNDSVSLYKSLVKILPTPQGCQNDGVPTIAKSQVITELANRTPPTTNLEILLDNLMVLIKQNPKWGVVVSEPKAGEEVQLAVKSRPLSWICRVINLFQWVWGLVAGLTEWILWGVVFILSVSLVYRGWAGWSQRKAKEKQEMFNLVEQATGLLYQHLQMVTKEGKVRPSYMAIDHIRDQLIPPMDRKAKARVWQKVVAEIRNDSRVRENVERIFGEEFRVWQWLPDLALSPAGSSPRSPTVSSSSNSWSVTTAAPAASSSPNSWSATTAANSTPNSWPHVPTTAAVAPGWQGCAFQLGKHVAAPPAPPTSCLKVRHMFDVLQQTPGWERAVKEEIVRRCSEAKILHIAVDTKSEEGTVYIKTHSTDDAGKVFRCLHGQWYRGQLVTAKYLRLERYHERFPESKSCTVPLKC